jgi:hypothetical protein
MSSLNACPVITNPSSSDTATPGHARAIGVDARAIAAGRAGLARADDAGHLSTMDNSNPTARDEVDFQLQSDAALTRLANLSGVTGRTNEITVNERR